VIKPTLQDVVGKTYFSALLLFFALFVLNTIVQPRFLSPFALRLNLLSATAVILVAIAQGVVVLQGRIDLSLGAIVTLANVTAASVMDETTMSVLVGISLCIAVAVAAGALNGVLVGLFRLPAVVATFATGAIYGGLALVIMPAPGGFVPEAFYVLYQKDAFGLVPVPLFLILIALVVWDIIRRRKLGRYIYAVGSNEVAAYSTGLPVVRVRIAGYAVSGFISGLAALMVTMQSASGDPNIGGSFTLASIAAVVVGGVSLYGGRGTIFGASLGAVVFTLLNNVIFFMKISSFYQDLIRGVVIIVALVLSMVPYAIAHAKGKAG